MRGGRLAFTGLCLLWLTGGPCDAGRVATNRILLAPGSGKVRALVIGIDQYRHVVTLKGAVADARDIETSLRKMGASDVTTLTDDQTDRDMVLRALDSLLARTQSGDSIIISLAGHGSKEDERIKGSSRDGSDEVFLLAGFDPKSRTGATQKILNHEFHHYILEFERRGAQVIFVADTCYGGGLVREIAPGATNVSYRQVPRYRLVANDFTPVSTTTEAFLTAMDFERTTFLAAVDSDTKAPEVIINGAYRGALSYAMARAIEGGADEKGDGQVTLRELIGYVRRVVYQLSDERQNIVAEESPRRSIDSDVVLKLGKADHPVPAPMPTSVSIKITPKPQLTLTTTSNHSDALSNLKPLQTPFDIVPAGSDADVVWDSANREAISGGDKIALDVDRDDIPGIIDRTAAIRDLKDFVVRAPQAIRVSPDASLHHRGSRIEVQVTDLDKRSLILLDVNGSGIVQMIYPVSTSQPSTEGTFRVPFEVRDPFGADELLAISSAAPMKDLTAAFREIDGQKSAGKIVNVLSQLAPADARIGLLGVFTVP